jgi:hypothetical protein
MEGHVLGTGISLTRPVTSLGVAGALAAAVVAMTGGSAVAATTAHQFTLCSTGNYSSGAVFSDRHLSTVLIPAGRCVTLTSLTGISSDHVTVLGAYNTAPDARFTVGSFSFNDNTGGGADAAGTTTAPQLERW